jgi:hypothetical protein
MRMFRPFAWISESRGCDKLVDGQSDPIMAPATCPVVERVTGTAAKRKRETTREIPPDIHLPDEPETKRHRADTPPPSTHHDHSTSKPEGDVREDSVSASASSNSSVSIAHPPPVDSARVCEAIESQFSLEILLKHNELRLINQELAKCQVALEQLRRCHLIPYPIAQGTPESMLGLVNGTGPALQQGPNVPKWAPPYGVIDGPYARHYAKWLIPDPSFDGNDGPSTRAGKTIPEGRATRYSMADGLPASKARTQRGASGSQKLQALAHGYPQTKDKAGPCVLKRSDGQMVKLVCLDCHRENFSSTQGFINHCRIAHHRDFKSHEEAAVACGQPIEVEDGGGIVGEEKAPSYASGLVHPMVRNAPMTTAALAAVMSRITASLELHKNGDPRVPRIPSSAAPAHVSPNFVAASSTPFLSEMMRRRGFDQDFSEIVGDARTKIDLDDEDESDDPETPSDPTLPSSSSSSPSSATTTTVPPPPMRMPARAGVSPPALSRPTSSGSSSSSSSRSSSKGVGPTSRPAHATPVINTAAANQSRGSSLLLTTPTSGDVRAAPDLDVEMMEGPSIIDLSPNTVASNKPPSLVSDDGEYDDGTDVERESSEEEDEDSDVAEIDIEDDAVDKVVPLRNRGSGTSEAMHLRKEDKHVTFVSPVKEKERRVRRT